MKDSAHHRPVRRTIALVLAGGRGSRLQDLTENCAKPAVHFGGKFRIIDFVLSNCVNSGLHRIGVLTQYKSHSLLRHLQHGWSFLRSEVNEFIDLLPAQQRVDEASWYRGTADAVYQNIDILREHNPKYILVLAGDHVYKMNYASLIEDHVALGAPCTVACIEVPLAEASAFGVMTVDASHHITRFDEKPAQPQPMLGQPGIALASMGVYVFDADYLFAALQADIENPESHHDFGKDLIPAMVARDEAMAHSFDLSCVKYSPESPSYWRDVGTVDAYWAANIDLTATIPQLDLYDKDWPIWTYQPTSPPAKFVFDDEGRRGMAVDSLVSGGCIVSGALLRRSVLFTGVHLHSYSSVEESVLLPDADVARHCRLRKVVVDEGCHIPAGMSIGFDAEDDARRFHVSPEGVVLVTVAMLEALRLGQA
ncbi:MAG: glucose-1-phosphate adenylyltransferase [Gammaproteobacteria bacterium]|uniref:glucose-1-phosphate adenylyltransferase n=1 Tax=Rhodoferax sp. TaxID=50421 RepID=UPI00181156EC|nr:glucose-1-phosphate adenylyltransferase [Rhodoferax sp.]MBU3898270.1 glucose-1-phosphate adenylyltransferase [Gammaproteobacteria bacterium]MBA3059032.1 glucose-1-phosphate adenylyltransferase [Rhodoferax sp.]MBU3997020.1 glucose-1-phosphate adenylyltransferase [Gammaproteobacteria bacterium]MBU4081455.1 glucose-1-phosphate adenylyltransferase [Gammaproteobacteria bacterium]MBU4114234.1 glucose-1-phosphate adenylyltransferase [Gammaproteobacteria bacterium]